MFVLHHAPDNASLIVRLALGELGLPCRVVAVDRPAGALGSAAFRRLNPQGLLPVLETPDGPLWETGAILLWLADRYGRLAPPPDSPDRGHFLKWLFFVSNTLHADLRQQFHPSRYVPEAGREGHYRLLAARLDGHFAQLDAVAADPPGWFAGPDPTALDIYVAVAMRWARVYTAGQPAWFDASRYPALRAMAAALETRPAIAAVAAADGLGPTPFSDPQPRAAGP
jgi:glutathione S-transferase